MEYMKKKKTLFIAIAVVIAVGVCGVILISSSPKWSALEFEAVIKETITQPDGEIRIIVERTTQIYGSPMNSLGISGDTKLLDKDEAEVPVGNFKEGTVVRVSLKNAFTEEVPFYYPTVYEIRIIEN